MAVRFEDVETPGYIRIVEQDEQHTQAVTLSPQDALDLLHWLFERRDQLEQLLQAPTQKLPRIVPPEQHE